MVTQTLSRSESGVRADAPRKRLFTREEYHAMGEAGVFAPDERVELWKGEVVTMAPVGNRHTSCTIRITRVFSRLNITDRAIVLVQGPVVADASSEPEPDFMLLAFRDDLYDFGKPRPQDVLLLAEISDSSLDYDRNVKLPRYAEVGIPEVWIVNLQDDCIESHTEPTTEGYGGRRIYRLGESVAPTAFPDLRVAVSDIIPRRTLGQ